MTKEQKNTPEYKAKKAIWDRAYRDRHKASLKASKAEYYKENCSKRVRSQHLCECTCGEYTYVSQINHTASGRVKGQPNRYLLGHQPRIVNPAQHFWERVDKVSGPMPSATSAKRYPEIAGTQCWPWIGGQFNSGYGVTWTNGTAEPASRVAWFLGYGSYPECSACHKCNFRLCCRPEHMYDGTDQDNMDDMVAAGNSVFGVRNPNAKLNDALVLEILGKVATCEYSHRELAAEYGVDHQTIGSVVRGKTWKHVLQE